MVQQYIEQALLAAVLAVKQGLIAPDRAAAMLGEVLKSPARSWLEVVVEQRFLNSADADALQLLVSEQLQQHAGDAQQTLTSCQIDSQLRAALKSIDRPELTGALQLTEIVGPASQSDLSTSLGDRYATLGSAISSSPNERQDPYVTGAPSVLSEGELSEDRTPPRAVVPSQTGGLSGTTPMADSQAGLISAANAPTHPDQVVLPSESVLDVPPPIADDTASPPEFRTLDHSTRVPEQDYATLSSGMASVGDSQGGASREQDSIPWPLRFRVLREHAKGGLGKVSVAEDLELHREVAFKEIQRSYADDEEARNRFLLEAEITGGLEHPGIVPVYGLGTHADGRPYYAMRFIRGRSMQQAIEHYFRSGREGADPGAQQLEFRQLIRRFIDVCNAIDYAHNRGILHRDLKPSNVMLGDYGETLVVDWGIAKAVSVPGSLFKDSMEPLRPQTTGDSSQTMMGVAIGTPQFMSPEQAHGKLNELGPASDVYSLGATLYCLLTGVAAFTSRELSTVLKQVKGGTFPPPIQVNPTLPKPLNAICLKAMALIPALRYGSARALAEDIEHWLADEPVVAYEENRWERISRWVRHNQVRAQAIGVSVLVVAVVATVATVLIEHSRRAEVQALAKLTIANQNEIAAHQKEILAKKEAVQRSTDARQAIDTWLAGMSSALDEFPGLQHVRRRLLTKAAMDYEVLADEKGTDPELQLEAVKSLVSLADVHAKLNAIDDARKAFSRAEGILQKLIARPKIAEIDPEFEEAEVKTKRGLLEASAGQHQAAETYFQEAISVLRRLVGEKPTRFEYQITLGTAQIALGRSQQAAGQIPLAGRNLQGGLLLFQTLQSRNKNNIQVLTATAAAETDFARYQIDSGQPLEALKLLQSAIKIHDDIVAEFPKVPEYLARRATAQVNLAESQRSLGLWPAAILNYESSVKDLDEVVAARSDVPSHRENLAVARTDLGQTLRKLGNNKAAVPVLEQALENFDQLSASYPIPRYIDEIGNTRTSLAQVQSELGHQEQALELINQAIADYLELLDLYPQTAAYKEGLGIAQSNRGRILARQGDLAGGMKGIDEGLETLKAATLADPKTPRIADNLALAWTIRGQLQYAAGQIIPAQDAFQQALALREKLVVSHGASPQYRDSLAWLLATCPCDELRDGKRAADRSRLTTSSALDSTQYWLTMGAAQLAINDDADALDTLNKSLHFRGQDDGVTLCLKSLAESKLKKTELARKSLAAAKAYQTDQKPADEELAYWIKQAEGAVGGD